MTYMQSKVIGLFFITFTLLAFGCKPEESAANVPSPPDTQVRLSSFDTVEDEYPYHCNAAVFFVIDVSGSMDEIAPLLKATILTTLTQIPDDIWEIGIVTFPADPNNLVLWPLQPLNEETRPGLVTAILAITTGNSTDITTAMLLASGLLQNSPYDKRLIIVFTDGIVCREINPLLTPFCDTVVNTAEIIQSFGINISSVGFDLNEQKRKLLRFMASGQEGFEFFYEVDEAHELADMFRLALGPACSEADVFFCIDGDVTLRQSSSISADTRLFYRKGPHRTYAPSASGSFVTAGGKVTFTRGPHLEGRPIEVAGPDFDDDSVGSAQDFKTIISAPPDMAPGSYNLAVKLESEFDEYSVIAGYPLSCDPEFPATVNTITVLGHDFDVVLWMGEYENWYNPINNMDPQRVGGQFTMFLESEADEGVRVHVNTRLKLTGIDPEVEIPEWEVLLREAPSEADGSYFVPNDGHTAIWITIKMTDQLESRWMDFPNLSHPDILRELRFFYNIKEIEITITASAQGVSREVIHTVKFLPNPPY